MANTKYSLVSIHQGSWKWQRRFALKAYEPQQLKNGKTVWRLKETISKFIKPTFPRTQKWVLDYFPNGVVYGSFHNLEVNS